MPNQPPTVPGSQQPPEPEWLSKEETQRLIMSFALARKKENQQFTQDDVRMFIGWATETKINATLLEGVLGGEVLLNIANDELHVLEITPQEKAALQKK